MYGSPWELVDRLLKEHTQSHSLYWRNPRPGIVRHAMLFFTVDSGLIAGLTVATADSERAGTMLLRLAESVGARYGYALGESPPPSSASEFEAEAHKVEPELPRLLP